MTLELTEMDMSCRNREMPSNDAIEVRNDDGTLAFKCLEREGIRLPLMIKDPDAKLKEIQELEYKDGDIIIATYPKVGTSWLRDSIGMLLRGKAEVSFIGTMFELFPTLDDYKKQETRRVGVTHLRPAQLSETQKAKAQFIFGIRNPKDVAVSMFYHFLKDLHIKLQATWDHFFELFIKKEVIYGWFFDYYREWQKFIETHPDQVLVVYYENMHKDYKKELKRIADFLQLTVADDLIAQIAKKGQLKTARDEIMKDPKILARAKQMTTDGSLPFYRKGEVGDWKNHFTVAQNERFDQVIAEEMKGLTFKFDYAL